MQDRHIGDVRFTRMEDLAAFLEKCKPACKGR